jgi:small subunit ribosomal protein S23
MKHSQLSRSSAYDTARREFYQHRHLEDIRRRIAKEEAMHVGAYFGKGPLEIGMALEDKSWEGWKRWAAKQIEDEQSMRAQMFSGPQNEEPMLDELEDGEGEETEDVLPESTDALSNVVASTQPFAAAATTTATATTRP